MDIKDVIMLLCVLLKETRDKVFLLNVVFLSRVGFGGLVLFFGGVQDYLFLFCYLFCFACRCNES